MRNNVLNFAVVGFVCLLSGCQTSGPANNVFSFSPPPYQQNLTQSVQDALMRSGDPAIAQVHVETNQTTVILRGYVKKIRQSDTAEQVARQVPGVTMVENRIIVRQ